MNILLQDFLQALALISWILVKIYQILVELRLLIQWFVNINPYFEPFQTLWILTNPVFNFGRGLYPKILGFDITPGMNFRILLWLEAFTDNLCHGQDPYNYFKFNPNVDYSIPRILPLSEVNLPDYIN